MPPTTPRHRLLIATDALSLWSTAPVVHGRHVLVAAAGRVAAIDVVDPDAPTLAAELNLGADVIDFAILGDTAWALSRDGDLFAIDLSH